MPCRPSLIHLVKLARRYGDAGDDTLLAQAGIVARRRSSGMRFPLWCGRNRIAGVGGDEIMPCGRALLAALIARAAYRVRHGHAAMSYHAAEE